MTRADNFGKYFRYKLGKRKSSIIIFAILNFLSIIMPCIILSSYYNNAKKTFEENQGGGFFIQEFSNLAFYLMAVSAVICMIMITITTVKSLKIYHNRAAMDTLGCLPLSYGERFWGDLLSVFCANFISLVPFSIVSLIMTNSIKSVIREISEISQLYYIEADSAGMLSDLIIILIFVYIGIYAVTTFVTSCCGKFGSAVLFSFVSMTVLPGIYTAYANYFLSFVIGADAYKEICLNVGMLPPFGAIFSIIMRSDIENLDQLIGNTRCLIISILITAAFIVGAYFIGKNRKAEKIGEGFVFRSVHHAMSLTLVVLVIGVFSSNFSEGKGILGVLFVLLISFFVYVALELSQNKSFKGFWKTVLRFAAVFGACFAFLTVVRTTNSFDFYKKLPRESSIKEIRVSGKYFYSEIDNIEVENIYKENESVSEILSEHKKLLTSEGLKTGDDLKITYVTKNGIEMTRGYYIRNGDDPIKTFSDAVNKLTEFDPSIFGILNDPDLSDITVNFDRRHYDEFDLPYGIIRDDKINELAEILKSDIKNNYFDISKTDENTMGYVEFKDKQGNENEFINVYSIVTEYKDTLEFLNDPDNYVSGFEENTESYYIRCTSIKNNAILSNITLTVSKDESSGSAKELLSYITAKNSTDEYSDAFSISDDNGYYWYRIKNENENAAIKAMLRLFREKYAQ